MDYDDVLRKRIQELEKENARLREWLSSLVLPLHGLIPTGTGANQWLSRMCPHCFEDLQSGELFEHKSDCVVTQSIKWLASCKTCNGTGEVDSGAPDSQGNFIGIACPDCDRTGLPPLFSSRVKSDKRSCP